MKKVINGSIYDTDSAEKIEEFETTYTTYGIFVKRNGDYFTYDYDTEEIFPSSYKEVDEMLKEYTGNTLYDYESKKGLTFHYNLFTSYEFKAKINALRGEKTMKQYIIDLVNREYEKLH